MCVIFMPVKAGGIGINDEWLGKKPRWAPDISLSTTFSTKYIWRGWNLGDQPVMQFDSSLSKWGLTLDVWGNYSCNNNKDRDDGRYQEITELDYTVDYTFNVGKMKEMYNMEKNELVDKLSFSFGYIYYTFPNVDWGNKYFSSQEIYTGVLYDCFLKPFFKWYWDISHGKGADGSGGDGSYFIAGVGHTFDFGAGITTDLGITGAYNDEQWTNKSGFADMVFSGAVNIPVLRYFIISPRIAYSLLLDRNTYNDTEENEFYGGVTAKFVY